MPVRGQPDVALERIRAVGDGLPVSREGVLLGSLPRPAVGYDLDNHQSIELAPDKTTTLDLKLAVAQGYTNVLPLLRDGQASACAQPVRRLAGRSCPA